MSNWPIYWEKAIKNGLLYVSQLLDGNTYAPQSEMNKYGLTEMQYNQIKAAIPRKIKDKVKRRRGKAMCDEKFHLFMKRESPAKYVYNEICPVSTVPSQRVEKLEEEFV